MNYESKLAAQEMFFKSRQSLSLTFRKNMLEKLKMLIQNNEVLLLEAIAKDFGKSSFDTYVTELSMIYKDIEYYMKNLHKLCKPKSVSTNMANLPGSSKIYKDPLGCVLIIGAWNYPFQLTFCPLIAAIAAGNCCIIKPSELPSNTMFAIAKVINENFDPRFLYVASGGVETITAILKLRFDKIFFTGSPAVGKIVYKAAAEHLTPVTLELGGKSPVLVCDDINVDIAAKRIVWGKFLNAGQTCIAPDYILADERIKASLITALKKYIELYQYISGAEHYTRIINERNFDRLIALIDPQKVVHGGSYDKKVLHIAPTVMDNVIAEDKIMQEEIFGPILPIISYKNYDDALDYIRNGEKPLAAYLFTNDKNAKEKFLTHISFGGGCINDIILHVTNDHLPFGGVGQSGIGNYHGKYGFDTFTHQKSILKKGTRGEPNIKYPPYSDSKLKWIKRLLKI